MNPSRSTSRRIVVKMAKVKERILKAAREKHIKSKTLITGELMSLSTDFFTEMLQAKGSDKIYSNSWKVKAYNLGYSTQQGYNLEQKERERISQTETKRIQQYYTYPKRNIKRSSLNRKEKCTGKRKSQQENESLKRRCGTYIHWNITQP